MNLIKTDAKRRETRQTLLQPIRKATSMGLHKRKPALPQPWETSHWRRRSGGPKGVKFGSGSRSREKLRALQTDHVGGALCAEPTLMLPESPAWASSCILGSREKKNCTVASEWRKLSEKWRLQVGQPDTLGMNLQRQSFKWFCGTELIKRAFLWHCCCWRQEKDMLISEHPGCCPQKNRK